MSARKKAERQTGRVVMDGGYTYWTDIPLAVGDKVEVTMDPIWRDIFGSVRTVTGFESNYNGPMQRVIRKLGKECDNVR